MAKYIGVVDTAKIIRKQLAQRFPGVKFSVQSQSYSGGASIDVYWTDGPAEKLVDPVLKNYQGEGFDGMIDMAYSTSAWLLPDGTAAPARSSGTTGSKGVVSGYNEKKPGPQAEEVHFGAHYVFGNRRISNEAERIKEAEKLIRSKCRTDGEAPNDRFGNQYVRNLAYAMLQDQSEGESLETAFDRVVMREPGQSVWTPKGIPKYVAAKKLAGNKRSRSSSSLGTSR